MTRKEFYRLTDILNSEILGNFMHGGEADELIAMFEEVVEHSNILEQEELVSEKKCMLIKDIYTDEDRMILCKDCDERCEYSKKEEPVSEPNKELAETYLAVFDKKFPVLPTLKGKQLADYKNFLNKCQQIFSLKEWGIYPIQAKLFKKLSLLWAVWGAEHLQGVCRQDEKEQDIPVSEESEEALAREWQGYNDRGAATVDALEDNTQELAFAKGFYRGAKWQKQHSKCPLDCPAFSDGYKIGMKEAKQQMMKDATEVIVAVDAGGYPYVDKHIELYDYDKDVPLAKEGDRYKVILIKEG